MKAPACFAILAASFAFGASAAHEFNQVDPFTFDPADTDLVASRWIHGIGCPPGDAGCPTGDKSDRENAGLLLVKTGATANNASAGAVLKNVSGITLTQLGYDIRSGSHCGAGAPRFNVVTTDGVTHFVGCASPPPAVMAKSAGWMRLRWTPAEALQVLRDVPQLEAAGVVVRMAVLYELLAGARQPRTGAVAPLESSNVGEGQLA